MSLSRWSGLVLAPMMILTSGGLLTEAEVLPLENIQLAIEAPAEVQLGDPVPLTLSLRNTGDRPVELVFGTGPEYLAKNILITGADGTHLRSSLFPITMILIPVEWSREVLRPGATLEFSWTWDQRDTSEKAVAPGTYPIRGQLYVGFPGSGPEGRGPVLESASRTVVVRP